MILGVSRETEIRLHEFEKLVRRWNPRINLVAPSTLPEFRHRHIDDCLQLAGYVEPGEGQWVDLGSGGGLPGIVLAIVFAENSMTRFVLIESDQRKASFLRTVIRILGLRNATVLSQRIEVLEPMKAAYISARALAPLPRLMPYLSRHLADSGQAWFMKGKQWQAEIDAAARDWRFTVDSFPSATQSGAAIIKISGVSHV